MARADELLAHLEDSGNTLAIPFGEHAADAALLDVLVHVAFSDGLVQEEEGAVAGGDLPPAVGIAPALYQHHTSVTPAARAQLVRSLRARGGVDGGIVDACYRWGSSAGGPT